MKQHEPEREAAGRSNRDQLVELWQLHRGWVRGVILAHQPKGPDTGADTDDLLQEVAMKLIRHWPTLERREAIGPWLRTVAINVARSAGRTFRRRDARTQSLDGAPHVVEKVMKTGGGSQGRNLRDRGRTALRSVHELPAGYRDPLLLALRGLSGREISVALELPISTIETRLCRARAMVREAVRRDELSCAPAAPQRSHHSQGGLAHETRT